MMTEYAYLAGIVDGEGTITIHRHRQHNRDDFQLRPRLTVANTHRGMLEALVLRHGGSLIAQPTRGPARSPSFIWRVCGTAEILKLVREMRPYLIIKADQADAMITFLQSRLAVRIGPRRAGPYSAADHSAYAALRDMNKREVTQCD